MKRLRSLYNAEIYPEVTILWKTLQLANYPVATLLLDNGLGSVDHQMLKSGDTCLLKALKEDVTAESAVCLNNEKDREEIIRFLLDDGDEWWSDPAVLDAQGQDGFHHSAELALRHNAEDYLKSLTDIIEDNGERQSDLQKETKLEAAEARKKAVAEY